MIVAPKRTSQIILENALRLGLRVKLDAETHGDGDCWYTTAVSFVCICVSHLFFHHKFHVIFAFTHTVITFHQLNIFEFCKVVVKIWVPLLLTMYSFLPIHLDKMRNESSGHGHFANFNQFCSSAEQANLANSFRKSLKNVSSFMKFCAPFISSQNRKNLKTSEIST